MIKTITKYKLGEEPEVDSWALAVSEEERLRIATELVRAAWRFAHDTPFPNMDRSIIKYIRHSTSDAQ